MVVKTRPKVPGPPPASSDLPRSSEIAADGAVRPKEVEAQLDAHRAELEAEHGQLHAELDAFREHEKGFTSMSRLAVATKGLLTPAPKGDHGAGAGAGGLGERMTVFRARVSDPEGLKPAPQRQRMEELEGRLALIERARERYHLGGPLLDPVDRGNDFLLDELDAMTRLEHAVASVPAQVEHRLDFLEQAAEERDAYAAREAYLGVAEAYLLAVNDTGESVLRVGQEPSLTGYANQLIEDGALRAKHGFVLTAAQLEAAIPRILKAAAAQAKQGAAPPVVVSKESLQAEVDRLRALEAGPLHHSLLGAGVERADGLLREARGDTPREITKRFFKGIVAKLDEPDLFAMMVAGGVAVKYAPRLMKALHLTSRGTPSMHLLRLGRITGGRELGQYVVTRAVEGTLFHTGMNAFNLARGKPERATWKPTDYLQSVALFEVLGAAHLWQGVRPYFNAVIHKALALGENTLALSLMGLGQVAAEGGDLEDALQVIASNLQFLLAMEAVGGIQAARNRFRPDQVEVLRRLELKAKQASKRAESTEPGPEQDAATAEAITLWGVFASNLTAATEAMFKAEGATPRQPRLARQRRVMSAEMFAAGLDFFASHLREQGLPEAEVERFVAEVEEHGGIFDYSTNSVFLSEAAKVWVELHELSHGAVAAADRALIDPAVECLRSIDDYAPLVELAERLAFDLTPEGRGAELLEELLAAHATRKLPAELEPLFERFLDEVLPSGESIRQSFEKNLLLLRDASPETIERVRGQRAEARDWSPRAASSANDKVVRLPVKELLEARRAAASKRRSVEPSGKPDPKLREALWERFEAEHLPEILKARATGGTPEVLGRAMRAVNALGVEYGEAVYGRVTQEAIEANKAAKAEAEQKAAEASKQLGYDVDPEPVKELEPWNSWGYWNPFAEFAKPKPEDLEAKVYGEGIDPETGEPTKGIAFEALEFDWDLVPEEILLNLGQSVSQLGWWSGRIKKFSAVEAKEAEAGKKLARVNRALGRASALKKLGTQFKFLKTTKTWDEVAGFVQSMNDYMGSYIDIIDAGARKEASAAKAGYLEVIERFANEWNPTAERLRQTSDPDEVVALLRELNEACRLYGKAEFDRWTRELHEEIADELDGDGVAKARREVGIAQSLEHEYRATHRGSRPVTTDRVRTVFRRLHDRVVTALDEDYGSVTDKHEHLLIQKEAAEWEVKRATYDLLNKAYCTVVPKLTALPAAGTVLMAFGELSGLIDGLDGALDVAATSAEALTGTASLAVTSSAGAFRWMWDKYFDKRAAPVIWERDHGEASRWPLRRRYTEEAKRVVASCLNNHDLGIDFIEDKLEEFDREASAELKLEYDLGPATHAMEARALKAA